MQIKVYSKQGIRKATPERKTILIAINDASDITKSRNYITRDKYTGIVWLYFDDIETEVPGVSFTKEHAKQIIDVVESHSDGMDFMIGNVYTISDITWDNGYYLVRLGESLKERMWYWKDTWVQPVDYSLF